MELPNEEVERLLQDTHQQSIEAFSLFYEEFSTYVFHIALSMLKDKREAEDICHDVFLEVYRNPLGYDSSRGSVKAWIAVKTRSRCLDLIRKKERRQNERLRAEVEHMTHTAEAPEELVLGKLQNEALQSALEKLPEAQRRVVSAKFFAAQTQRELSEELDKPIGSIKSMVRYGLIKLRKHLQQSGWLSSSGGGNHES
jgi:RNA polymerase sigma factor (sigma-70 family)